MAEVPLELPTGRIVGTFIFEVQDNNDPGEEPQLVPVTGDIIIKSSIDNLSIFDQSLGKFITFRGPHKAIINSLGELATPDPIYGDPMYTGISLWSNDSDKLSVKGWTYTATFNLKTVEGKNLDLPPATFTLATGQELDLADVIRVPATPGYGLPQAEGAALRAEAAAVESSQSSLTAIQMAQSVIDQADAGEFDGEQGLPGNATMRVDTSVGTRVFISDGVTERMVSGDTGWRAVQWWGTDGVVQGTPIVEVTGYVPRENSAGGVYFRRINNVVYARVLSITTTLAAQRFEIPVGFSAGGAPWPAGFAKGGSTTPIMYRSGSSHLFFNEPPGVSTESVYATDFQWVTKLAWPATLPGTPA